MPPAITAPTRPSFSSHNSGLDLQTVLSQAGPSNTTVYVGGVAPEVSEHLLRQVFIEYGVVEEIKLQAGKKKIFKLKKCL
jgi:RNA recognition motif-containing protein